MSKKKRGGGDQDQEENNSEEVLVEWFAMKSLSAGRLKDDKGSLQLAGYRVIEAPSVTGDTWRPATPGGGGLLLLVTTDEQRVSASGGSHSLDFVPRTSLGPQSVCMRAFVRVYINLF